MFSVLQEYILTYCRKQAVSTQSQELEALEAKLRETEERLKQRQSRTASPAGKNAGESNSPHRRKLIGDTFSGQENDRLQSSNSSPLATQSPASSSVLASTMSRWRPSAQEASPGMSGRTGYGNVHQPDGQHERRYAE